MTTIHEYIFLTQKIPSTASCPPTPIGTNRNLDTHPNVTQHWIKIKKNDALYNQ